MDSNQDTVRSLADLLVEDDEVDTKPPAPIGRDLAQLHKQQAVTDDDSVFGDMSPEDAEAAAAGQGRTVRRMDDVHVSALKPSRLERLDSLLSQISSSTSHKEPPPKREYKLKLFVSALFVSIVVIVSVVLIFAHSKSLRVELGKKILLEEDTRLITVQNYKQDAILVGKVGLGIPEEQLPYDCSSDKLRTTHLCLLWRGSALLNLDYREEGSSKCYDIAWRSLSQKVTLRDCYTIGQDEAFWYGGALMDQQQWPLNNHSIPLQPFITGTAGQHNAFGPVLERYWLSTRGVSLFAADLTSPLHVSWNAIDAESNNTSSGDGQLCLVADNTHSVYKQPGNPAPWLNYTVCSNQNVLDAHLFAVRAISDQRNISQVTFSDVSVLRKPAWSVMATGSGNLDETSVKKQTEKIQSFGHQVGLLIVGEGWQTHIGDFAFKLEKFSNISALVRNLKDTLKCRVALSLYPYISIQSVLFEEATYNQYLVRDAGGEVPGLFQLPSANRAFPHVTGAVDVHENATAWLKEKLDDLKKASDVDVFRFLGGEATRLPFEAKFADGFTNPNEYTTAIGTLASRSGPFALVHSASHLQGQLVIIHVQHRVGPGDGSSLRGVISKVLTLGLLGYPFVLVDFIDLFHGVPITAELFQRCMQLATFLPIMHLSVNPEEFGSDAVNAVDRLLMIRDSQVMPHILNVTTNSTGLLNPIIRPVWWIAPDDPKTYGISDSFLVGDRLLVAPILQEGVREREVYLPKGRWKSDRGFTYDGPIRINLTEMGLGPDDPIGYFVKLS